jgi:hypothetical protein
MVVRQKLAVLGVLLLAEFVVVASIIRVVTLEQCLNAADPVWSVW